MDSVTTIQAGSTLSTKFAGTASHLGGSCQWSMSYDMGATWNGKSRSKKVGWDGNESDQITDRCSCHCSVVHTQMGGCMSDSVNIDVPIPSSAPSGEALFGWTWFNHAGKSISRTDPFDPSFVTPPVPDRYDPCL